MNGRERMRAVGRGEIPDRVPVCAQLSYGHIIRVAGLSAEEAQDPRRLAEAERSLYAEYGFDGVGVTAASPFLPYGPDQPWGGFPDPARPERRSLESTEPGDWPPLETSVTDEWAEPYDLARESLGSSLHIGGWILDSFSLACGWFGTLEESLLAIMDFPERFQRLVEYMDQLNVATTTALVRRARVDSVGFSSPYAGSGFISRKQYKRQVAPSLRRLAELLRGTGVASYIHTCGFTGDRLELEADTGVDGVECMDPPPLGNVELSEAKRRIGGRVFLKGNIDSVNVLLRGSDREVEREIIRQIEVGMPGGRYILSTACSVAPEVRPERVRLMVTLAERYGRYGAAGGRRE